MNEGEGLPVDVHRIGLPIYTLLAEFGVLVLLRTRQHNQNCPVWDCPAWDLESFAFWNMNMKSLAILVPIQRVAWGSKPSQNKQVKGTEHSLQSSMLYT